MFLFGEEEEGMADKAGPSLAPAPESPPSFSQHALKVSVVERTSPTVEKEPVTVLQEEVRTAAQSLHRRHEHRGDKHKNWSLTPVKPILFLGDS